LNRLIGSVQTQTHLQWPVLNRLIGSVQTQTHLQWPVLNRLIDSVQTQTHLQWPVLNRLIGSVQTHTHLQLSLFPGHSRTLSRWSQLSIFVEIWNKDQRPTGFLFHWFRTLKLFGLYQNLMLQLTCMAGWLWTHNWKKESKEKLGYIIVRSKP